MLQLDTRNKDLYLSKAMLAMPQGMAYLIFNEQDPYGAKFIIHQANKSFLRQFNLPSMYILGQELEDILPEITPEIKRLEKVTNKQISQEFELASSRTGKSYQVTAYSPQMGHLVLITAIHKDNKSDEKAAEQVPFYQFINLLPLPVYFINHHGIIKWYNSAFAKTVGHEFIEGKKLDEIFDANAVKIFELYDEEINTREDKKVFSEKLITAKNQEKHLIFHKTRFKDIISNEEGILSIIRDNTEQTHTLFKLKKNAHELNIIHAIMKLVDAPGILLPTVLQGVISLIPTIFNSQCECAIKLNIAEKSYFSAGFQVLPHEQKLNLSLQDNYYGTLEVYSSTKSSLQENLNILRVLSEIISKIIYRYKLREEIEKQQEIPSKALAHLNDGIAYIDQDENFKFYNKAAEEIFEVNQGGLKGENMRQFVSESSLEKVLRQTNLRSNGKHNRYELEITTARRNRKSLMVHASPYINPNGEYLGAFTLFYDNTERKKAETALTASDENFRYLFYEAPIAYQSLDPDGNLIECNSNWCKLMGYNKNEVLNKSFYNLVAPKDKNKFKTCFSDFGINGRIKEKELNVMSKEGKELIVSISGKAIFNLEGKLVQIHCIFRDITVQKTIELQNKWMIEDFDILNKMYADLNSLSTTEEIYQYVAQLLVKKYDDLIVIINRYEADRNIMINNAFAGLDNSKLLKVIDKIGFSPFNHEFKMKEGAKRLFMTGKTEEVKGKLVELANGYVPPAICRLLEKMFNLHKIYLIGFQSDNNLFAGLQLYYRNSNDIENINFIQTLVHHASLAIQRKQIEEELLESEAKYRMLVTSMQDGVLLINRNFQLLTCNEAATNLLKIEDTHSFNFKKLNIESETGKKLLPGQYLQCGKQISLKLKIENEAEKWISLITNKLDTKTMVITISDITTLKDAQHQLEEINVTKDKFFNIIAHDLKSPFNQLKTLEQLARESLLKNNVSDGIEYLDYIKKSANSGHALLENLLEWSRSQTGKLTYSPEIISLGSIVKDVFKTMLATAANKNIEVENQVPDQLLIYADPYMLHTVLRNLLNNAIKFSLANSEIIITATQKLKLVEINVIDQGVGLSDEIVDNLFRLDFHYSTMGTNNEKGIGVGLVLCKELVEKNKGTIRASNNSNSNGCTFSFTIPAHP